MSDLVQLNDGVQWCYLLGWLAGIQFFSETCTNCAVSSTVPHAKLFVSSVVVSSPLFVFQQAAQLGQSSGP